MQFVVGLGQVWKEGRLLHLSSWVGLKLGTAGLGVLSAGVWGPQGWHTLGWLLQAWLGV